MTTATTTYLGHSIGHFLRDALDAYRKSAARRAAYRRTLRELRSMSDRELADIGIYRGEISNIASAAAAQI